MSSWDFRKEGTHDAAGANTVAGLKAGYQPYAEADNLASKRNVIATEKGWVRRQIKRTDGNPPRIIDEVLVAAHPGGGTGAVASGYANSSHLGFPDIAQVYTSASSFSKAVSNTISIYVVFNEPIAHGGSAGDLKLPVANTAGGNNALVAVATAVNSNTGIVNANNTLVFEFTTISDDDVGTYSVGAGAITNATATAVDVYSLNTGGESANLVITGAVSNTFSFAITL
jgi:hypothetical protein